MTTAQLQTRPVPATVPDGYGNGCDYDYGAATGEPAVACMLIPLSEFGQSPDSPGLDEWFEAFAARNKDRLGEFEITHEGELKIMPPTGIPGYWQESEMTAEVVLYARTHGGKAGGPTGRFRMPDGSRPGPDAIWISDERWNAATDAERRPPFLAIAPDFICEIVSPSNRGPALAAKVMLFMENGTRLAWVINAERRLVTIYRPGQEPETRHDPETLSGEDVMPGFVFEVRARIFDNAG